MVFISFLQPHWMTTSLNETAWKCHSIKDNDMNRMINCRQSQFTVLILHSRISIFHSRKIAFINSHITIIEVECISRRYSIFVRNFRFKFGTWLTRDAKCLVHDTETGFFLYKTHCNKIQVIFVKEWMIKYREMQHIMNGM